MNYDTPVGFTYLFLMTKHYDLGYIVVQILKNFKKSIPRIRRVNLLTGRKLRYFASYSRENKYRILHTPNTSSAPSKIPSPRETRVPCARKSTIQPATAQKLAAHFSFLQYLSRARVSIFIVLFDLHLIKH